jgi:glycosyltransferase involved in cell wall biosynthesis
VTDLIHDGTDGFILRQSDDSKALAGMLQRLHSDENFRRNAAAALTAANWTWDRNAKDMWELLEETSGKKTPH